METNVILRVGGFRTLEATHASDLKIHRQTSVLRVLKEVLLKIMGLRLWEQNCPAHDDKCGTTTHCFRLC